MVARGAKKALTPDAFGKFLRWLSQNDEEAVREYQSIRMRLVRYFVHKGCPDPDDLFDRTIDVLVGRTVDGGDCPSLALIASELQRTSGGRTCGNAIWPNRWTRRRTWLYQRIQNLPSVSRS